MSIEQNQVSENTELQVKLPAELTTIVETYLNQYPFKDVHQWVNLAKKDTMSVKEATALFQHIASYSYVSVSHIFDVLTDVDGFNLRSQMNENIEAHLDQLETGEEINFSHGLKTVIGNYLKSKSYVNVFKWMATLNREKQTKLAGDAMFQFLVQFPYGEVKQVISAIPEADEEKLAIQAQINKATSDFVSQFTLQHKQYTISPELKAALISYLDAQSFSAAFRYAALISDEMTDTAADAVFQYFSRFPYGDVKTIMASFGDKTHFREVGESAPNVQSANTSVEADEEIIEEIIE